MSLSGSRARVLAVRRNRILVAPDEPVRPLYLERERIPHGDATVALDGPSGDGFALLEIDAATADAEALATLGLRESDGRFADVMMELGRFAGPERERLLRALALAQWANDMRFCPNCGRALRWDAGATTRSCDDPVRPHRHFARTDPATIVLVTDGERALLGRQATWPRGMYSTLAGFVEPGETAEATVAREVLEETGVRVTDVAYVASESWPFPRSLMLGFTARATTTDVAVGEELEDARWFSRDEVADMQARAAARLPHFETIARHLMAAFASGRGTS